jgi:uncharacterized membrane protein
MKNGAQAGPISTEELRSLLSSGALPSDTMVWRQGLASWEPARIQADLATSMPPAAPLPVGAVAVDSADVEKNKVFAVICYLPPLLFIVSLIAARQSKFAMYHCNQALVLTIAAFAFSIINMILGMVLVFIPVLGWMIMMVLHLGLFFGCLALVVMGLINAANGVCKPLPVIGHRFTLIK